MINTAVIMGRLTFEPELKTTPNSVSFIRFQLAVDRQYQVKGEERQTDFIDCIAWKQTAEFISRYFHKGSMIALTGSIQTSSYTDKNGNKRKQTEVVANNVSFCGSKSENGTQSNPETSYAIDNSDFEEIIDDNDLPF